MATLGNFLIDEYPLMVQPSLAQALGLNEALFLQQLHYWLQRSRHNFDGKPWVYNTFENWQQQNFPFWAINTLKRAVGNLEKKGYGAWWLLVW